MPVPSRMTHYEVLQVASGATPAVIQGAYRALLKTAKGHPDLGGTESGAQTINEAYSVLSNAESRAEYDRYLVTVLPDQAPPPLRTQYILICPACRKPNTTQDEAVLERSRCGACNALLLPKRRVANEQEHARAFRLGIYMYDKGLLPRSVNEFESAVRLDPRNPRYHYWLGRCLYRLHRLDRARRSFHAAARIEPKRFHFQFWLGQINYALKNFDAAAKSFNAARGERPRHAPTLLRLASCLFHLGRYSQAARVLEKAIEYEPSRLQLYTLLGVVFLASKDRSAALTAFRHAEKLSPQDVLTRKYLSMIREG